MTCAGCVTSGNAPAPVARTIPPTCEELAARVPLPSVNKGDDMRALAARHRAGLVKANKNLDATRTCQARQRAAFGAAK